MTTLSPSDARTILEMADTCYAYNEGPDLTSLLRLIEEQYPELVEEFDYLPAFKN